MKRRYVPQVGGVVIPVRLAGISHNPQEHTHAQDLVNGANTLLHTVLALAQTP